MKELPIFICQDTRNDIGQAIQQGVYASAKLELNINPISQHLLPQENVIQELRSGTYSGAIVHAVFEDLDHELAQLPIPVISTSNTPLVSHLPHVQSDDVAAGKMAGEFLQKKGFRDVLYLGMPKRFSYQRLEGLMQIVPAERIQQSVVCDGKINERDCFNFLDSTSGKSIVVACDDSIALRVAQWTREKGIKVPDDMAILGFNNELKHCETVPPHISSVAIPYHQIGRRALSELVRRMRSPEVDNKSNHILIPPVQIVERQSTDGYHGVEPLINDAVALIHKFGGKLAVDDVLQRSRVTRRTLETMFKQQLGTTPHRYILHTRVDRARKLLCETQMNITEIAFECGFSGSNHIDRAFHSCLGKTPTQVRKEYHG